MCGTLLPPLAYGEARTVKIDASGIFASEGKVVRKGSIDHRNRQAGFNCVWALNALQNSMMFKPR